MDSNQLKTILRNNHLSPNFTYGQNFLIDDIVLEDIVDAAGVGESDAVLEIGPGIGNLTRKLCERAKLVLSIEKDPKFLPILKAIKKDHKNFRYEIADALEYDFQKFFAEYEEGDTDGAAASPFPLHPVPYKVVANIPYYITGKIIQMLMTAKFKPQSITILTQKEVAQNIIAAPGDLSILAISVQIYGEPKIIRTVAAKSFHPAPKVDSSVLQIKVFDRPRYDINDEKKFFKVVKACFAGKRKQLHNTLKNNLQVDQERIDRILAESKIDPAARPQELSIEQWIGLANKIFK